ncbi:aliphatic sulfonate ABC transporter substrate-binding protein [Humisphaera borealis]|uniref:Aliphatic sulfonate ABC transporter substrate-binding protein n=1 Tax=Humisphaera borealis TaxID=2807512 RepID=A0A7M2X1M7_9BACT|nr:aliphatic sulfonate ABC transporter substrate-binding protein [Humisphaera borealis]QOV91564.1 aliphatic sulfonate ABC transporter substrate-binding protein [Humisphaera borealis]
MPRLRLPIVLLSIAFLAGSMACKKDGGASGPSATPPAEVRLGYFANFTHAQAVLGVSSGDFEKAVAPSKFGTKIFNAGPSLIEALFAGEIDIGYIGPGPALNGYAKSKGTKVRIIAGAASNGVLIVARPDAGINDLKDLVGKKIATPQFGNTQDIAAKQYFRDVLKQKDLSGVMAVPNAEQASMMLRKQVDAAWAPEPWGSLLISQAGAKLIAEEKSLWAEGAFATTVVITTPEFLQKHPDVVEKVLGVHVQWTDKLKADPTAQLPLLEAALFKLTNKGLPAGVLAASVKTTNFTEDPLPHTFTKFAQWAYDLEFSKEKTDPAAMFDTAIVKKVREKATAASPGK